VSGMPLFLEGIVADPILPDRSHHWWL
jgi:hypothetical protein